MESGFKGPCFSYAHWPGLSQVVPTVTCYLFWDQGWKSGVPWEVCAQTKKGVTAEAAEEGSWEYARSVG